MICRGHLKHFLMLVAFSALATSGCGAKSRDHDQPSQPSQPTDGPTTAQNTTDGTITSGGGYVYGLESNPWFIGNVTTVRYCIDMDEEHFGASRPQAEASIKRAVALWKSALTPEIFAETKKIPQLTIGSQEFIQVDCAEGDIDVAFQLGKLSQNQERMLGKPRRFIASTVQTSYDEENMHGRGFIYIAPESGPLRPDADDLAADYWRANGNLILDMALLHELGHVFGIPHSQSDFPMGATLCESMVTNKSIAAVTEFEKLLAQGVTDYRSMREWIEFSMQNLFSPKSGSTYINTWTLKHSLGFNIDDTKENYAKLLWDDSGIHFDSFHQDVPPTGQLTFSPRKWLRTVAKFEQTRESKDGIVWLDIRIPKSQKFLDIPADRFSESPSPTSNFNKLNLLKTVSINRSGYIVELSTGKKIFARIESKPSAADGLSSFKVQVVVDGRIEDLN